MFQAQPLVAYRGQGFLAVADDEQVEKTGHGLGMERARTAGNDQGMSQSPVFGRQGDSAQIEHRQHIAVGKIVLQGKAQHVELAKGRERLQAVKRQSVLAEQLLHVGKGREGPFASPIPPVHHRV